jgi:hypothetical protein
MGTRAQKADQDEVTSALHAVEHLIGGKLTMGSLRTPATEAVRPQAIGLLGASKGGKARADKLSATKRKAIAKKAAAARWAKQQ